MTGSQEREKKKKKKNKNKSLTLGNRINILYNTAQVIMMEK